MYFLFKLQTDIKRSFRFSSRISIPEGASEISWRSCYIPGPLPEAPIELIGGGAEDCISNTFPLNADAVVQDHTLRSPAISHPGDPLVVSSRDLCHTTPMQVKSVPSRSDAPTLFWFIAPVHVLGLHPPTPCLPLAVPHDRGGKGRRAGKGRRILPEDEADSLCCPVTAWPQHIPPG